MESGRCYCQTVHHGTWPYISFIKFRLIWSATVFWSITVLLIGELYNQGRCDRHARQLYGSVAGNSGDIFFATCFRQSMIFCAKFYFSAQMATMAIGNANPDLISYCFLIANWVINWRIIQSRKVQRHARQLHGSVAGNSGDIFFPTCFCQFMIFLCQILFFCANGDNGDR